MVNELTLMSSSGLGISAIVPAKQGDISMHLFKAESPSTAVAQPGSATFHCPRGRAHIPPIGMWLDRKVRHWISLPSSCLLKSRHSQHSLVF